MGRKFWKKASRITAFALSTILTCTSVDLIAFASPLESISDWFEELTTGNTTATPIENGYCLQNDFFVVETGKYGEITSLKIKDDEFNTNYVMNASNSPQQDTDGHEWVGELMFSTKLGNAGEWKDSRTQSSGNGRKVELVDNKVIVTYENATGEKAINDFKVTETYSLEDGKLRWETTLKNTSAETLLVGDWGMPLPFNEMWTQGDEIYETRTVDHSFVGKDSSYIYVTRPSGQGKFLVMTPDVSTGAGFEYQDHWRDSERESNEKAWCQDQSGWQNGLNVFYIHSDAIKKTNRGYLENTSLTLGAGESKSYAFNFTVATDEDNLKKNLYNEGLIDAVAVPGMTYSIDMPAKMYLHTKANKDDISFTIQCPHETGLHEGNPKTVNNNLPCQKTAENTKVTYNSTKIINGENYHIYDIQFGDLGQNNVIVDYKIDGQECETVLQFYMMDNAAEAMETHSNFMVESTQLDLPGKTGDKVFDDWMMDDKKNRYETDPTYFQKNYWGWGDDWGLTHGEYIAEKNVYQPVAKEIKAIDDYLNIAIWNGLMREHQEDYLIHDFLMEEPNSSPTYRGYAYPHIYNTYFSMYKIASKYPETIEYLESADTYLMRAYHILDALYNGKGVAYNYETGVMGELTTPAIIAALDKEGHSAEAENIRTIMKKKYDSFKSQKYPYGSEYSYDNTGEEAVYTLAKVNKETDTANAKKIMKAIDLKTRACRGLQPVWYHYADPVTNCGENWWQFQYTASLIGYCMDDYLRLQDNDYTTEESVAKAERMNYAAKLANLTCINSGQIDSDPENIGAVAWTYQAEMGNLGGQGTGGGNLHNGWRQMAGESDLGLFGAMQILSSDVANDPVFGLFGYGCEAKEVSNSYVVSPLDGLNTKLNIIDKKIYVELKRDQYTKATISKDKDSVELEIKNLEGTAHESEISLTGLEEGTYGIKVNEDVIGKFAVKEGEDNIVPVKLPAADSATVSISKNITYMGSVSVNAGENQTVALSEKLKLIGEARDTNNINKVPAVKWTLQSTPEGGSATIKTDANLVSFVDVTKVGTYIFKLTAVGTDPEVSDTVTVTVSEDAPLAELIADYNFDNMVTKLDGQSYAENANKSGLDAQMVGNPTIDTGVSGNGVRVKGSNKDGYVKFDSEITKDVKNATIAVDVKLYGIQTSGARLVDFSDSKGNSFNLQFVNGNEIAIESNGTMFKSGIVISEGYWKNIAVTVNGGEIILYVDGLEKYRTSESKFKFADMAEVQRNFMGRGADTSTAYLNGVMDNYVMKSVALSAEEMRAEFGSSVQREMLRADISSIITGIGVAPKMPEKVNIVYSDGIYEKVAVEWDEVLEDDYCEAGEFTVNGYVNGLKDPISVKVIVASGVIANLAPTATPTAIYNNPSDLGGVTVMNDGFDPSTSSDTSHGAWHNWGGNQGAQAWVQYAWEEDVILTSQDVYYFKDTGGNFYPANATLYYLDSDGTTWKEVTGSSGVGVEVNKYNYTSFDPIKTKSVKIVMTPGALGSGVIEWKVYGYSEVVLDKQKLNETIVAAKKIKENLVTDGFAVVKAALVEAQKIADDTKVTQGRVNRAVEELQAAINELVPLDGNYAFIANPTYSFCSSWESQTAVNDGAIMDKSGVKSTSCLGTWGNLSDRETVTYTWAAPVKIANSKIMLWYDGSEPTNGGIKTPKSYNYEYLDELGNWKPITVKSGGVVEIDKPAATKFEAITTQAIRLTMMKQSNDENGIGLSEWQIFGEADPADKATMEQMIALAESKVEADYTFDTFDELMTVLEEAKVLNTNEDVDQSEVNVVVQKLSNALEKLVKSGKAEKRNLAPTASVSASRVSNGSVSAVNDNVDPTSSAYSANMWYISGGENEEDYVQYDFKKNVAVDNLQSYYYKDSSDNSAELPQNIKYEYKDGSGKWNTIYDGDNAESDQYVTVDCSGDSISTKTLRMTLKAVTSLDGEEKVVKKDFGLIEWKVNGLFEGESTGDTSVDKGALNDFITIAKSKSKDNYTEVSFEGLVTSLNGAETVAEDTEATQDDVNQSKEKLKASIDALVIKPNTKALEEQYNEVKSKYTKESYRTFSYERFERALKKAKDLLEAPSCTNAEINSAMSALNNAIESLVKKADTTELKAKITEAEGLKEADYLAKRYAAMGMALEAAKVTLSQADIASQEEIDTAFRNLKASMDNLEKHADFTLLKEAIAKAEMLHIEDYTADSYAKYCAVIQKVKAILNNSEASQTKVDAAINSLKNAKKLLVVNCDIRAAVTYDSQGGSEIESVIIEKGKTIVHQMPVREGYSFAGWYTKPNGQGILVDDYEEISSSITLYACWYSNTDATRTILSEKSVIFSKIKNQIYTGRGLKPAVTVKFGKVKLVEGIDYSLSYKNNIKVGNAAKIVIIGIGDYAGSIEKNFVIQAKKINSTIIAITDTTISNNEITNPSVKIIDTNAGKVLEEHVDYTVSIDKKKKTVVITGMGNYTGSIRKTFKVYEENKIQTVVCDSNVIIEGDSFSYTGKAIKPNVSVNIGGKNLILNKDYKIAYKNNINAGTAIITVTGKGTVKGSYVYKFTITPISIKPAEVQLLKAEGLKFNGVAQTPKAVVSLGGKKLRAGKDYTVTYRHNVQASEDGTAIATVVIGGAGNYDGTVTKTFLISPKNMGDKKAVNVKVGKITYDKQGKVAKNPTVTVKIGKKILKEGREYTTSYNYDQKSGKGSVVITSLDSYKNFVGSKQIDFKIKKIK
ncbi:MAG: DUF5695 domain-containing protein [Lachnospiraceae bacterium]|nr:DUF5695 domain-containing protein [Lachnospiraceae bacterium]